MNKSIHAPAFIVAACIISTAFSPATAAPYSQAEFTRVDNDVKVLKDHAAPATATLGQQIKAVTSVATGTDSRAEMRFQDRSLTRLGANTRFTLRGEGRTLDLNKGTMLLQVPKRQGGATIRTAAITAAITGTTVLMEYSAGGIIKFMVIEGEATLSLTGDPSVFQVVTAGQIITTRDGATFIPMPEDFDIARLLKTSKLISNHEAGTPNQREIAAATQTQIKLVENGELMHGGVILPNNNLTISGATYLNNQLRTLTDLQRQVTTQVREVANRRPPPQRNFTPQVQISQTAPVTTTPQPVSATVVPDAPAAVPVATTVVPVTTTPPPSISGPPPRTIGIRSPTGG